MAATAKAHAKHRPPSSAKRWLSCPATAQIMHLYPNESTEASLKGDFWHEVMEDTIRFNHVPVYAEPDVAEAMLDLLEYVQRRYSEMRGPVQIYTEVTLKIPETGEVGTVDIILVGAVEIEIIDEKSGYVPVNVRMNAQMLTYLCGALAEYGQKKKRIVTIHQPNYDHIDGSIRSYEVSDDDLEWFRGEISYSLANDGEFKAGTHCKDTYCPHRGTCAHFMDYVKNDLSLGWQTSELNAISDDDLSKALDMSDELAGWRNVLRSEGMKRIMNMDRTINGYKVVKGRKQRAILDPTGLINSFHGQLGEEWALKLFPTLQWAITPLVGFITGNINDQAEEILKCIGTPKHVEDVCKKYAQVHGGGRGAWKRVYDQVAAPYIRETNSGLSLERAIDARPAHKRGSEFGPITSPGVVSII